MPSFRETLSHNFEGSSFVWQGFRSHPVLSILGTPLFLLEAALLPIRMIIDRKDSNSSDERDLKRLRKKRDAGISHESEYYGDQYSWWNSYEMRRASPAGHNQRLEPPQSGHHRGHHPHKHSNQQSVVRVESALYPGWRLPHGGLAARPRSRVVSDHKREEGRASGRSGSRRASSAGEKRPSARSSAQQGTRNGTFNGSSSRKTNPSAISAPLNLAAVETTTPQTPSRSNRSNSKAQTDPSRTSEPSAATAPGELLECTTNGDQGSYISQAHHSLGSRTTDGSETTWAKPPSSIRTYPQFRPTLREDSVAPWDSVSQRGGSEKFSHTAEVQSPAQVTAESGAGRQPTVEEVSKSARSSTRSSRRGVFVEPNPWAPRPRAATNTTIDTGELLDTVAERQSRTRSGASRTQTYRTAPRAARSSTIAEAEEEDFSDSGSVSSYCSTCDGGHQNYDDDGLAVQSGFSRGTSRMRSSH